jgi:predicted Rossmann fold flavoprotein
MQAYAVIIIGAGAAGLMCAIEAAKLGKKVLLLDHSSKIGRKILISGGGRCNFTNIGASPENYYSANPHFCKSALSRYTPQDFIDLVCKHKIAFHEKKLGQLFCNYSAQSIVDMLVKECRENGVAIRLNCKVEKVAKEDLFIVTTNLGVFTAPSLVVATGGLSVPQIGATGFGYEIARQFNLNIIKTAAALDGFVFTDKQLANYLELTGVSIDTIVSTGGAAFRENILFTHTGLSGPASLQASLYWNPGQHLNINLVPELDLAQFLMDKKQAGAKAELKNVLADILPKRFCEQFCRLEKLTVPVNTLSPKQLEAVAHRLHNWQILPATTVGYRKAEVTRGGVDTKELSSTTMEAKKVKGLYFIGEVVDVTGWLGGYNFQWAWSSGYAAAQAV